MQQTNRQGAQAATKGDVEGNIQGAFAVQQTTGVNMYLTKSEEEKSTNKATLTLKKNRQGCLCTFESFYFNNGTLQIDMSSATTSADVELAISEFNQGKQKNWENVHSELHQHYIKSQTIQQDNRVIKNNQTGQWEYITGNTQTNIGYDPNNEWPDNF
jgi:hypothetical protein